MKNLFKIGILALAIASFAACKGKSSSESGDTSKTDSMTKIITDTTKKDTSIMPDSLKKDTTIKTTTTINKSKTSVKQKSKN
jgi:hypothetical protein